MPQGDPSYWDQQAKIPKAPEVPQLPDVAFEITCASCRHTLDKHVLDELKFVTSPDGHERMAYRWGCNTALAVSSGLSVTACQCHEFKPSEQYTRVMREEPPF